MRIVKDFILGLVSYYEAAKFIVKHNLYLYFIAPVALIIAFYFGGEYIFNMMKDFDFENIKKLDYDNLKDEDLYTMLILGIELVSVFVIAKFWNYLVLNILTPMNTFLSTKTDTILTGNVFPITVKMYLEDTFRAWRIMGQNMVVWMLILAIWYILSIFLRLFIYDEIIDVINTIIVYGTGFYVFGFSLLDYTSERRRLNISDSYKFVRKHVGLAFALGMVYSLCFRIPEIGAYVGVIVAPVLGVIAATLATHKLVDLSKNPHAKPKGFKKTKKINT
ncbi:MAG: hypothetical protein JXR58_11275 [Bacteroidales bacterium]|nr:hypothetical protein [Bacteroidales bacterium]